MDKTLIDINRAIESTVTVATNEWKYVADVELDLDPELPKVLCMPSDLNQVVLNMIVNAAHAISAAKRDSGGRGKIQLQTRAFGNEVEIRITDDGTGIPKEINERIFDPFFTTKPVGKGTGQGLSIARTVIVERHGGQILVESSPGEGSCFIIRLPVEDSPEGTDIAA
jgi:signal transduction histidine kinase